MQRVERVNLEFHAYISGAEWEKRKKDKFFIIFLLWGLGGFLIHLLLL